VEVFILVPLEVESRKHMPAYINVTGVMFYAPNHSSIYFELSGQAAQCGLSPTTGCRVPALDFGPKK
jgi:hypothetical protein